MTRFRFSGGMVRRSHRCSVPGCPIRVKDRRWGCHTHWNMLPASIQRKFGERDYSDTVAWERAHREALAYIEEQRAWQRARTEAWDADHHED